MLRELEDPRRGSRRGTGGPGESGASGLGVDPGSLDEKPVCHEDFRGRSFVLVVLMVAAALDIQIFGDSGVSQGFEVAATGSAPGRLDARVLRVSGIWPTAVDGPAHIHTDAILGKTDLIKKVKYR